MDREAAFIASVVVTLTLIPILLDTHSSLTAALVVTLSVVIVTFIIDRRVRRPDVGAVQLCTIQSPSRQH